MNDKIIILEDTDGDGVADKCTVLADHLHVPTGLEFWNGGLLVGQQPDLMFLKDTKATARPTTASASARHRLRRHASRPQQLRDRPGRRPLFPGRHVPSHAGRDALGPAGAQRQRRRLSLSSRARRNSRRTSPTASPTRTGTSSTAGGRTSSPTAPATIIYSRPRSPGSIDFPKRTAALSKRSIKQRTRPCPGTEILSSQHFPARDQGNLLVPT